ncbi:unnamed protein product [Toxocara canis]|uniref:Rhomboid domain-containing protein n=1 Tax=Toxocara canis TaxID=6265 RepID=A0A183UGN1_TOXCA|nr:unnamed protein product [Toxocara canis]
MFAALVRIGDTFCYFWMELGQKGHAFSETGWNGDDDHDSEGYVRENIRSTCSQLPKHLTISGITHIAHELFVFIFSVPLLDCIFYAAAYNSQWYDRPSASIC